MPITYRELLPEQRQEILKQRLRETEIRVYRLTVDERLAELERDAEPDATEKTELEEKRVSLEEGLVKAERLHAALTGHIDSGRGR